MANGIVTWLNGGYGFEFVGQGQGSGTQATGFKTLFGGDGGAFDKAPAKKGFDVTHVTGIVG